MADVDCIDDDTITLINSVQVVMQPSDQGANMAFVPFLQFSNEFKTGIKIRMGDVLCITTPMIELENQYSKLFGSGIQIASTLPKF
jgi:hypothetical protein